MACANQVGVKNLAITFRDCDGGLIGGVGDIRSRVHELAQDELPKYMMVNYTLEGLSGGRVKRTYKNARIEIMVVRDLSIPLAYYQGRASIDIQVEHVNGIVVTGIDGSVVEVETSDGNDVTMNIEFKRVEELLPSGALAQV